MDSVKYFVALVILIGFPPAFLFWLIIHPFARSWRKIGPGWT